MGFKTNRRSITHRKFSPLIPLIQMFSTLGLQEVPFSAEFDSKTSINTSGNLYEGLSLKDELFKQNYTDMSDVTNTTQGSFCSQIGLSVPPPYSNTNMMSPYSKQNSLPPYSNPSPQNAVNNNYSYASVIVTSLGSPTSSYSTSRSNSPQLQHDDFQLNFQMNRPMQTSYQKPTSYQNATSNYTQVQSGMTGFQQLHPGGYYIHDPNTRRKKEDYELTPVEYEKRRQRRERNKLAALRCRTRRKERIDALEMETAQIEGDNKIVQNEINSLQKHVEELQKLLKDHECRSHNKD